MMQETLRALAAGDVAIVATDTVYGLAARPGTLGYERIFALKQRPSQQVLPWLVKGESALDKLAADVPDYAHRLAAMFWPGALTLVLRASDEARELGGVAEDGTIAFRCPDDAGLLAVLDELDEPLACTSANIHGQDAPARLEDICKSMLDLPGAASLPAACPGACPSVIVDCTGAYPKMLRGGSIPEQVLFDVAAYGVTL